MSHVVLRQPADVRLMNATASVVFTLVFALLAAAAFMWILRNPAFAIERVVVEGQPEHSNAMALQTNVMPRLQGNLFTLNLEQTQQAFEEMPWVRHAIVKRIFPSTLQVELEEHVPAALWEENQNESLMVNRQGEVFEANRGEVEHESLPRLSGPREHSAQVLTMYQRVQPLLESHQMHPHALFLNARGNWQAVLVNNAVLELGAGQPDEVARRLERFLQSLPAALEPLERTSQSLEYADLRHGNGYAIRLKGVVTGKSAAQPVRRPRR